MNKHSKIAILIAPLLLIGGFIASDYFIEYQAQQPQVFQLKPVGSCDIVNQQCLLGVGELQVSIFDHRGITTVNSTFPLDNVVLFLVDGANNVTTIELSMAQNPYYWSSSTPLQKRLKHQGDKQKLRLVANIKGSSYISEFDSETMR